MAYIRCNNYLETILKNYITESKDGHLFSNRKMTKFSDPKISLVIPMYNEEKNIKPVIRSIQNQSLQEIEIMCVNDNSNDKTLSILESLQKEDPRIEIITNNVNRGVIYSRIYGALRSKGEYVTFVDADDALCNEDILRKAYNIATKEYNEKIDIVHYQTCACTMNNEGKMNPFYIFFTFNPNNFNQVIKQPEIGDNYMQKRKNVTGSGFIFDKIYSKELIFRIADFLGPHIWNQNLIYLNDFLIAFASMKMAKSIVNIEEIGYWRLIDKIKISKIWAIDGDRLKYPDETNKKIGDYMIILERMLELTDKDSQSGEFREKILKDLLKDSYLKVLSRSIHFDTFLSLFDKLYNWEYIDDEAKKRIENYAKLILSFSNDSKSNYD